MEGLADYVRDEMTGCEAPEIEWDSRSHSKDIPTSYVTTLKGL